MELTKGQGVDRVVIAGGDNDTFAQGNRYAQTGRQNHQRKNYLGSGDFGRNPGGSRMGLRYGS